ncbi:hypothetical protein PMAYCL1PPCAC_13374, partial [Pristionchus mayeri]
VAAILCLFLHTIQAEFTPHFRKFLTENYGAKMATDLERKDLGRDASLGGKLNATDDDPTRQAVIFVHGMSDKISRFARMFEFLKSKGYASNTIYGSTWGDGGKTPVGLIELKCEYIKQIRAMIIAVHEYTGDKVDILAFSMGSPLTRKAILGGECVDTKEPLGPPLTAMIDTYVSTAGSNYGSAKCNKPLPVGTCNMLNGLNCKSAYLQDLNKEKGFEGSFVFSIFSSTDVQLGTNSCGELASPIRGGTGFVEKKGLNHKQTMDKTRTIQYNFITKHLPK